MRGERRLGTLALSPAPVDPRQTAFPGFLEPCGKPSHVAEPVSPPVAPDFVPGSSGFWIRFADSRRRRRGG
jgi:hypothetical protein